MKQKVFVYDPTLKDKQSSVRGIGRYLQILKENFENEFEFVNNETMQQLNNDSVFINPFFNFLQKPLTLRRIAHKQIAVIHDLIPLKYPSHFPAGIRGSINIFLNKFALRNYDLIITDSEASKKDIIDILGLPDNNIKVIYPCLPNIFLKFKIKNFDLNKNLKLKIKNYAIYVGDATWNKNLFALARAIKIADVNCVFVGKIFSEGGHGGPPLQEINHPWMADFKKFISETKDDKRFIFAGFVPDSELIKLYQQASFNILPSRDEGFGFSYLEAANFGCPSLLSGIPVLREISGGKAIFFDPNNPQDIAEKIKGFLSKNVGVDPRVDPNNKLINQVKKRSEFFSAEKFKEEFLSVISNIK